MDDETAKFQPRINWKGNGKMVLHITGTCYVIFLCLCSRQRLVISHESQFSMPCFAFVFRSTSKGSHHEDSMPCFSLALATSVWLGACLFEHSLRRYVSNVGSFAPRLSKKKLCDHIMLRTKGRVFGSLTRQKQLCKTHKEKERYSHIPSIVCPDAIRCEMKLKK